ncbi:MAG: PilZ domain-containing protein [Lamprobacter sp.]|uniref:PilZ domain-containing protein n=1 Tax=Lamprobacter sp. TaxID=3100796 RepID=UPI002B2582AD|nr:PilZ domain-containing protein [Lamprobacter sp.]MEA3640235.1 PilZ domain-containing protein [Lamprobacter sp.]
MQPDTARFMSERERRRQERVRYADPVQVKLIEDGHQRPHALLAEDVSESGLALTAPDMVGVGSTILMDFEVATATIIRLIGRVVWVARAGYQERYRLGVEFEALSAEARAELRRLVRRRRLV